MYLIEAPENRKGGMLSPVAGLSSLTAPYCGRAMSWWNDMTDRTKPIRIVVGVVVVAVIKKKSKPY